MAESELQHVQLPNDMTKNKKLTPNDLWVYICIKSFLNGKTKECFPSLKAVSERSELSIPTIRESIDSLVTEKWISVKKVGRSQKYYFKPYKHFEVFSYSFINKKEISAKEKAYLLSSQQFMFKDVEGYGKISYTDQEMSEIINLSPTKIAKYDRNLIDKGYLTLVKSNKKDMETGLMINQKFFKLDELGQMVVFALQKHEDKLEVHDELLFDLNKRADKTEENNKWMADKIIEQEEELKIFRKLLSANNIIM